MHACLPNCLRRPWGSPPRSTSHAEHLGYPTRAKLRQKCSDERTQQLYGRPKSLCPPCGSEGGDQCSKTLQSAARSGALESVTLQQLHLPREHFPLIGASELGPACCIEKREHRFKVSWYLCGSSGRSQLLPPGGPRAHYHGFDTAARKPVARPAPAAEQAAASSSLWRHLCKHQRRACLPRRAGQHDVLSTDLCRCARWARSERPCGS